MLTNARRLSSPASCASTVSLHSSPIRLLLTRARVHFPSRARLPDQPAREVLRGLEVLEAWRQLAPVNVFVVEPGVADGEDRAAPEPRGRHDHVALIHDERARGRSDGERADLFQVEVARRLEDGVRRRDDVLAGVEVVALYTIPAVLVELYPEARGQTVEVLELGVALVVAHQHQHAARAHPVRYRLDVGLFDVVWILTLLRRVRVGDDVDACALQVRARRGLAQRFGLDAEAAEDATPEGEAAVVLLLPLVVPRHEAARRVLPDFVVEVGVERDGLALAERERGVRLHLRARHQKRADALRVVRHDLLAQVVAIAAVAVRVAAQAADAHDALYVRPPRGVGLDEAARDAFETSPRDPEISAGQVAATRALRERVDEHAGGRRFEVVPLRAAAVEHLVPEARPGVLIARDGRSQAAQDGEQLGAPRMVLREVVEIGR